MRCGGVQSNGTAGEPCRIITAQRQVGVGDRRISAAASVAGRTWGGTGAFGTNSNAAQAVDMRQRSAAGTNLHHLNDRDAQRQARSLAEAADARDLKRPGSLRP